MASPRSKSVFHFTKSFDALKSIVSEEGFRISYTIEHYHWIGEDLKALVPMVCFCDIPLTLCNKHTDKYGTFGIGLKKEWILKNAGNPVLYVCKDSYMSQAIRKLMVEMFVRGFDFNNPQLVNMVKSIFYPMLYHKPYAYDNEQYHEECEWRIVPSDVKHQLFHGPIFEGYYEGLKDQLPKHDNIRFTPFDIKYLIVKNRYYAGMLREHIASMTLADGERTKLLCTIQVLDDINSDY